MELNKQQVITKINSSKTVTGLKLDADENTQLLNRKLDDKIRTIKMELQKNKDVTVVFIQNWHMELFLSSRLKKLNWYLNILCKKNWVEKIEQK